MYAIAVWDKLRRELTLARDRFGEKPLHIALTEDGLFFASEPDAIRAIRPGLTVDPAAVADYLRFGFIGEDACIWQEMHKLPVGCSRTYDERGHLHAERRLRSPDWTMELAPGVDRVATLGRLLRRSVDERITSADVEVGVLLSGGVDSTLTAQAAAALHPGVRCFTIAFDDPGRDESGVAAATAARLEVAHHIRRVTAADALALVDDLDDVYDEPFADTSAIPTLLLSRFAAEHVKVALGGDGGDELFSGYVRHSRLAKPSRLAGVAPGWFAARLGQLSAVDDHLLSRIGNVSLTRFGEPRQRYDALLRMCPEALLARLLGGPPPSDPNATTVDRAFAVGGHRAADIAHVLVSDMLVKLDRASMSAGLEVRSPFLDRQVFEFAIAAGRPGAGSEGAKTLPRALLAATMPEVARLPKRGFSVPISEWLRGPLRSLVEDVLDPRVVSNAGLVDPDAVDIVRNRVTVGRLGADRLLWALIVLHRWHENRVAR